MKHAAWCLPMLLLVGAAQPATPQQPVRQQRINVCHVMRAGTGNDLPVIMYRVPPGSTFVMTDLAVAGLEGRAMLVEIANGNYTDKLQLSAAGPTWNSATGIEFKGGTSVGGFSTAGTYTITGYLVP